MITIADLPFQTMICYFVFLVEFLTYLSANPVPEKCDEFKYYDHGTHYCEPCEDICVDAALKGTMDQCWELCQSYALILWPPETPSPVLANPGEEEEGPGFPLAGKIGIPVASFFLISTLVVMSFFIQRKLKKPMLSYPIQTATLSQDICTSKALLSADVSVTGAAGSQDSSSSTQERAHPSGLELQPVTSINGRHSVPGVPRRPNFPMPVSPEGDCGSFAMALPQSRVQPKFEPHAQPSTAQPKLGHLALPDAAIGRALDLNETDDLDSTELKTLLPSMSDDDSLPEGACGRTFTTQAYQF